MKIVSIWENTLWFRLLIFLLGISVIFGINFFLFWYFIWFKMSIYVVIIWIILAILLWYLLKKSKYLYTLTEDLLIIKTPSKEYKIPFQDIKKVQIKEKILLSSKLWNNFDTVDKFLYLCSFSKRWIVLDLWTHSVVISPRKFDIFYKSISSKI